MGVLAVIFLGCAALLAASSPAERNLKQAEVTDLENRILRILEAMDNKEPPEEQQRELTEGPDLEDLGDIFTRDNTGNTAVNVMKPQQDVRELLGDIFTRDNTGNTAVDNTKQQQDVREGEEDAVTRGGIFPLRSPEGVYKYNLDQARRACEERGAVLASYNRLYEAWQQGLSHCACGWLSDGTSRFPMQAVHDGCGSAKVNMCDRSEADAWCFRSRGVTFPLRSPEGTYKYNLDQARRACEQQAGAVLATYDQLYEAWQQGLNYCACGWLSDGTSRYPMQVVHKDCGSAAKVNTCGRSVADAWCFLKY